MKKIFVLSSIIVLLLILDNSFMPFLSIRGYYPSLLFIFALCYSIINESWAGLWIGIITGALQDVYFFNGFGINIFANMLMCVCAGEIGKTLFKEKSFIPVCTVFALTFFKGLIVFALLYIFGIYSNIYNVIFDGIYSFILGIFIYRWTYKLCKKEYMKRKWNF